MTTKQIVSSEGFVTTGIGVLVTILGIGFTREWLVATWAKGSLELMCYTITVAMLFSLMSFGIASYIINNQAPTDTRAELGQTDAADNLNNAEHETDSQAIKDKQMLATLTQGQLQWLCRVMQVEEVGRPLVLHYERAEINALVARGFLTLEKVTNSLTNTSLEYIPTAEAMRIITLYGDTIQKLASNPSHERRLDLLNEQSQIPLSVP